MALATQVRTEQIKLGDRDIVIADVIKSSMFIGTTTLTGRMIMPWDKVPRISVFYVGKEPILNIITSSMAPETTNKLVMQCGTIVDSEPIIRERLTVACENYFHFSQELSKALAPVFELLFPGLYVCYEARMIPTDGASGFFWNSYMTRREVQGTATVNDKIGKDGNYIPCFLFPTTTVSNLSENKYNEMLELVKSGNSGGGIAFHISGLFSALLEGHHTATACTMLDMPFKCIIIEPVNKITKETEDAAAENHRLPRITSLSSASTTFSLEELPREFLESFLQRRIKEKPTHYDGLKSNCNRVLRATTKKRLPRDLKSKIAGLPKLAMIESAAGITSITDDDLECLLDGKTLNKFGKLIISRNHYECIVTACNYLFCTDFDRFLAFAGEVLLRKKLMPSHPHVLGRLTEITLNDKIYTYFRDLVEQQEMKYTVPDIDFEEVDGFIFVAAKKYVTHYNSVFEERENEKFAKEAKAIARRTMMFKANMEEAEQLLRLTKDKNR